MSRARRAMHELNPNMLVGIEGDVICGIEDVSDGEITDPESRIFRLEYRSTPDGRHAIAYCLYSPWPSNLWSYEESHLRTSDGFLCLASNHTDQVASSPMDLATTIRRARYWALGFSALQATGTFPQP